MHFPIDVYDSCNNTLILLIIDQAKSQVTGMYERNVLVSTFVQVGFERTDNFGLPLVDLMSFPITCLWSSCKNLTWQVRNVFFSIVFFFTGSSFLVAPK